MPNKVAYVLILIGLLAVAIFLGYFAGDYYVEYQRSKNVKEMSRQIIASMNQMDIGDTLPDHQFETIDGDSVWLRDLLSEKSVLIVSVPQCQDCIFEAQELGSSIKDTRDHKYFIFVTWENPKLLEDIKYENKLASPFLYDHKRAYFSQFDISTYPFNITLNKNGVVLDMLTGAMWKEDFEEIIEFNKRAEVASN